MNGDTFINRFAKSDYEIIDTFQAGIVLTGAEIKAIRAGKFSLKDSFGRIINNEAWLTGAHIALADGEDYRVRKLLLNKDEIIRLTHKLKAEGLTLISLRAYFKKGKLKLEMALARGRKKHDKRAAIKQRDLQRDTQIRLK